MPRELARQFVVGEVLADTVHSTLEHEGLVALEGKVIRLVAFSATLTAEQAAAVEVIQKELASAGFEGKTVAELGATVPDVNVTNLLGFLVREGTTRRVGKDRYYDPNELAKLVSAVLSEIVRLGQVTPADLREKTGLSRKYLIPLLEWMDGQALTVREGDTRRSGPAARKA
jgi:selenocysteine-specific elongation factor